jgi:UDP-N-acetylglucosamine 2-epimerase (non-hydrolysing)
VIRTLLVFGTRPEAIKLAPLVLHLKDQPSFEVVTCVTAQHRSMLDQVLGVFGIKPDYDLDLMLPGQTLSQSTARMLTALEPVMMREKPDLVLVQGDTTTAMSGALAAFYHRIAVGHVEAGLRTGDLYQPFPEELNRVIAGRVAALHFAPTEGARQNLLREGVSTDAVAVTGNTGIDAVFHVRDALAAGRLNTRTRFDFDSSRKLILVTAHRRESFGDGFTRICDALKQLAARDDVEILYPVHRNPNVLYPVTASLGGISNVHLVEPLEYVDFVACMLRSYLLLTDSGGIQEEAPSLGKPVLVLRERTERPEAVEAGTVRLVGTDVAEIVRQAELLLDTPAEYQRMSRIHNPYGDGCACGRISRAIRDWFDRPHPEHQPSRTTASTSGS